MKSVILHVIQHRPTLLKGSLARGEYSELGREPKGSIAWNPGNLSRNAGRKAHRCEASHTQTRDRAAELKSGPVRIHFLSGEISENEP